MAKDDNQPELVCSLDIEAFGKNPLIHNPASIAITALTLDKQLVSSISFNLAPQPGLGSDPDTMKWWEGQPKAYEAVMRDQVPAEHAFRELNSFWNRLRKYGYATLYAAPAGYDVVWLSVNCFRLLGKTPYQRMVGDLRSVVSGQRGVPLHKAGKRDIPAEFFDDLPHTHVAIDDALEQGCLIVNLARHARGLPPIKGYTDLRGPDDIFDVTTRPPSLSVSKAKLAL